MRSDRVEVRSPALDQYMSLPQCVGDFSIEQLITHPPVEGLAVAALPGTARRDAQRLGAESLEPSV